MMQLQLSNELNDILTYAKEEAMRLGNYTVSTDHLVLGILRHGENTTVELLARLGANTAELKAYLEDAAQAKSERDFYKRELERLKMTAAAEDNNTGRLW